MAGDGDLYVLSEDKEEEWVSPRPVETVVADLVTGATDLAEGDLDDLETYVDRDDLAAHLDGDSAESLTFAVEGHDIVVDPDGTVDIDPA